MPAMKRDSNRPLPQQRFKCNQAPLFVGQEKRRHWITDVRRVSSSSIVLEPKDEPIYCLGRGRANRAHNVGKRFQSRAQWRIHVATMLKPLLKNLCKRLGHRLATHVHQ
jgi:hypothetical protein